MHFRPVSVGFVMALRPLKIERTNECVCVSDADVGCTGVRNEVL